MGDGVPMSEAALRRRRRQRRRAAAVFALAETFGGGTRAGVLANPRVSNPWEAGSAGSGGGGGSSLGGSGSGSQPCGPGSTQESVWAQVVAALRCLATAMEMQHLMSEMPVPRGEDLWGAGVAEGRWKHTGATAADEVVLAAAAAGEEEMLPDATPTCVAGSDLVTEVGNKGGAVCCTGTVPLWRAEVADGRWKNTGATESRPTPEGPPLSGRLLGVVVADGRWKNTGATELGQARRCPPCGKQVAGGRWQNTGATVGTGLQQVEGLFLDCCDEQSTDCDEQAVFVACTSHDEQADLVAPSGGDSLSQAFSLPVVGGVVVAYEVVDAVDAHGDAGAADEDCPGSGRPPSPRLAPTVAEGLGLVAEVGNFAQVKQRKHRGKKSRTCAPFTADATTAATEEAADPVMVSEVGNHDSAASLVRAGAGPVLQASLQVASCCEDIAAGFGLGAKALEPQVKEGPLAESLFAGLEEGQGSELQEEQGSAACAEPETLDWHHVPRRRDRQRGQSQELVPPSEIAAVSVPDLEIVHAKPCYAAGKGKGLKAVGQAHGEVELQGHGDEDLSVLLACSPFRKALVSDDPHVCA